MRENWGLHFQFHGLLARVPPWKILFTLPDDQIRTADSTPGFIYRVSARLAATSQRVLEDLSEDVQDYTSRYVLLRPHNIRVEEKIVNVSGTHFDRKIKLTHCQVIYLSMNCYIDLLALPVSTFKFTLFFYRSPLRYTGPFNYNFTCKVHKFFDTVKRRHCYDKRKLYCGYTT